MQVQKLLGDRVGDEILMLSITLDPDVDTPAVLKDYATNYNVKPGWIYLTGKYDDIEKLRRSMGVYDLDPILDADKAQHGNIITFGNDRNDKWAALPALIKPGQIVGAILRLTHEWNRPRSKSATSSAKS